MKKIFCYALLVVLPGMLTAQSSWTSWTKFPNNPVYFHNTNNAWNVASDPAVIKDSSQYTMIVSGDGGTSAGSPDGNTIIMSRSANGYTWQTLANGQNGVVVTGFHGNWDESMEMPELIKTGNTYSLFYCGYNPHYRDSTAGMAWGDLGLAVSSDDSVFTKNSLPVMTRSPNWYDQDGITDPTIVESGDTLYMIYVGWCTQGCTLNNGNPAFYSLKAISTDNGNSWTKLGLLDPSGLTGLQHPDLVLDADGTYSLFNGVDNACSNTAVGIFHSVGPEPFGPFTPVSPNPVFCMGTQTFEVSPNDGGFPSVINDNGMARMYYTGVDDVNFIFKIGLVESNTVIGVNEITNQHNFQPGINPFSNTIQITASTGNEQFELMNTSGQIIWSGKNISDQDFSSIASGLYFLKINSAGGAQLIKLVKE